MGYSIEVISWEGSQRCGKFSYTIDQMENLLRQRPVCKPLFMPPTANAETPFDPSGSTVVGL